MSRMLAGFKSIASKLLFRFKINISLTPDLGRALRFLELTRPPSDTHDQVRIGPSGDGGYLIPIMQQQFDFCFSPGVGNVVGFDVAMAEAGVKVFMVDGSVNKPPENHEMFEFEQKFLAALDTPNYTTLSSWIEACAPKMALGILQMDIEGGEYEVILSTPSFELSKFACLVVEFHQLELLSQGLLGSLILRTAEKITQTHVAVSRHVNNNGAIFRRKEVSIPSTLEVTFLRRDLFSPTVRIESLAGKPNIQGKRDFQL